MPVFIAAIGGMLINLVGTLAGRVLIALGISVVTYTGVSSSLDWMKAGALTALGGLPDALLEELGRFSNGQPAKDDSTVVLLRRG